MILNFILIILFLLFIYFEIYTVRYFFEKYFIVIDIHEQGMKIRRVSFLKKFPILGIAWSDIVSAHKVEGHDSSTWWYRNVQKKFGSSMYWRLVVKTKKDVFVFHPVSTEGLNTARLLNTFDKSSELEAELSRRNIKITKEEVKLIDTLLNKKDWYKK